MIQPPEEASWGGKGQSRLERGSTESHLETVKRQIGLWRTDPGYARCNAIDLEPTCSRHTGDEDCFALATHEPSLDGCFVGRVFGIVTCLFLDLTSCHSVDMLGLIFLAEQRE